MLEGWEWIIIGVVAIVIILWGPAKIPEFAKALGRAKGEFSKASKEFTDAAKATETQQSSSNLVVNKEKDEKLIETAQKLGISTEGKTRSEITAEISSNLKSLGAE